MQNKFIHFLFLLIGLQSYSQSTSTSPYSSYGLGEMQGMDNGNFSGIGNTTVSYFDSTVLNYFNPASYNTLGKGQPMFSVGVSSRLSTYQQNNNKSFNKAIVLNHFAFALSYGKHLGFAAGIKPYSRRGYDFYEKQSLGTDSVKHTYQGSGSLNEAFIGFSTDIIRLNKIRWAVGGNIGYVFDNVVNRRISNMVGADSNLYGMSEKTTYIKAVHYVLGTYFDYNINENKELKLSVVYDPSQDFYGSQINNLYVINQTSTLLLNTTGNLTGHFKTQSSLGLGLNYVWKFSDLKKGNSSRNSEVQIHANYTIDDWSKFSSRIGGVDQNYGWNKVNRLNFGFQYVPELKNSEKSIHANFFELVKYRVGYYQYTLPFSINTYTLKDQGYTVGLGIPILAQKSLSSVNLSFGYGTRGSSAANSIQETYYTINIGVSFAPASFERWFVKRKLD